MTTILGAGETEMQKCGYFIRALLSMMAFISLMAVSPVRAQTCIADKQDFDFMQTSPTKFHRGSVKEVKAIYQALLKQIGDPSIYGGASLFYAINGIAGFSQAYCTEARCKGTDILNGLTKCAANNNIGCYPVAAIYNKKLYCLLEPAVSEYHGNKPFDPFE